MQMTRESLYTGKQVSWRMADNNIMCGTVEHAIFYPSVSVTRIDGTACTIQADRLEPATYERMEEAVKFFANIGKTTDTEKSSRKDE
jgi:hypothetical protein